MPTVKPLKARILNNVITDKNGCWLWQLHVGSNGYGSIATGSRKTKQVHSLAHRISYQEFTGEIPEGLHIDHLCKVRHCVNPSHLEAVTPKENVHRSNALYKQQQARTHCPKGHEYTPQNTFTGKTRIGGISRSCKACDYARHQTARNKKRLLAV